MDRCASYGADGALEVDEHGQVCQDCAELDDENPDIVKEEALSLPPCGGPAPCAGLGKVSVVVDDRTERRNEEAKEPSAAYKGKKESVTRPVSFYCGPKSVRGDEKNEKAGSGIAEIEEPALSEADGIVVYDGVELAPVKRQAEGQCLKQIRHEEVQN